MSRNKNELQNQDERQQVLIETGVIDFRNRLALVLEGASGNAFAKKVGMSEAVIRDYLSGKTYPSLNRLAIIAQKCDVPIEWLVTGKGSCRLSPDNKAHGIVNIPVFDIHQTNIYGEKARAIGAPPLKTLPFDLSWLRYRGFTEEDLIVFWAKGDSLEPTISDYDALIVNKANNLPLDGYIYVIRHGDSICVKRLQNSGKNLLLLCDNDKYPTITILKDEEPDFEIIGRVVFILKDLF